MTEFVSNYPEAVARGYACKWGCSIADAAKEKAFERCGAARWHRLNGDRATTADYLRQAGDLRRVAAHHNQLHPE